MDLQPSERDNRYYMNYNTKQNLCVQAKHAISMLKTGRLTPVGILNSQEGFMEEVAG